MTKRYTLEQIATEIHQKGMCDDWRSLDSLAIRRDLKYIMQGIEPAGAVMGDLIGWVIYVPLTGCYVKSHNDTTVNYTSDKRKAERFASLVNVDLFLSTGIEPISLFEIHPVID